MNKNMLELPLEKVSKLFLFTFLVLYSSYAGPELPEFMKELFNSNIFRIFIYFLIVYSVDKKN
jgi:hypothetical protein